MAKKWGIDHTMVMRWVSYFNDEGIKGLEENQEKSVEKILKNR